MGSNPTLSAIFLLYLPKTSFTERSEDVAYTLHAQAVEQETVSEENVAVAIRQVRRGLLEGRNLADNGELTAFAEEPGERLAEKAIFNQQEGANGGRGRALDHE